MTRFATFAALIHAPGDPDRPLLVGAGPEGDHGFTLADLRRLAAAAPAALGLAPGDAVLLARAPATPEAPLAAALFACLAAGLRVWLPSALGPAADGAIGAFGVRAIVSDGRPIRGFEAAGEAHRARLDRLAARHGICHRDIAHLMASNHDCNPITRDAIDDILALNTTGSGGAPRTVRYPESAWMACGDAFERAGLLDPATLGGPTVCPALCHSMGVRAALLALWSRAPILFVQPEWLTHRPDEVARLLLAHPPRHLTAGPALLAALPALVDAEPALRRVLAGLRIAVSSGAPFDPRLRALLPETRLANAFGTTETQQITTTLLDPDAPLDTLGAPLPGVRIRVRHGELQVASPFAARGALGGPGWPAWHAPGDHVTVDPDGRLRHAGRADDCVSTGLGVELARGPVEARYADLPHVEALCVMPAPGCPGLVGLAFVGARDPADPALRDRIAAALAARAEVHPPSAPFDADRLWAVELLPGRPPLRGPGKIDRARLAETHRALIAALADPERRVGIELVDPLEGPIAPHPAWPERAPALAAIALDWRFTGGRGDALIGERGDRRLEVLDLVGGFGINLLGHGHPAIRAAAVAALDGLPIADQAADRAAEAALCRALAARLARETDRVFTIALANTGAEAVDLALRHALLRRRARIDAHHAALARDFGATCPERVRALVAANTARAAACAPVVATIEGGFHGLGLAARAALGADPGDARRALVADALALRTVVVPRDPAAADDALAALAAERLPLRTLRAGPDGAPVEVDWRPSNLLAVFAEPVQGEGGVHPLDRGLLHRLAALDAPLVLDEIQAGLGRCPPPGAPGLLAGGDVPAEVYLFGKALGGGVAKIAAVAIDRARWVPGFDAARGSTFAGDALGCRVASAVLDALDREDAPARAAAIGAELGAALAGLAARWPTVVRAVRGRGLLHGIELADPAPGFGATDRALAERGWGLVAASWLLDRRGVRLLPTTGAPRVLRIEPSIGFDAAARARLLDALDGLCATLASGDLAALIGHWADAPLDPLPAEPGPASAVSSAPPIQEPSDAIDRVAFLHPLQAPHKALTADAPSLARLDAAARRRLLDRLLRVVPGAPLATFEHRLFDGRVALDGITVCAPPTAFALMHRRGTPEPLRAAVQDALRLARDRGASIAVLGGYTSVITDAGRALLPPPGLRVVTGNTFTAAAVLAAVPERLRAAGLDLGDPALTVAVLGATGNLGRAIAAGLAADGDRRGRLLLVGRPGSAARLAALRDGIYHDSGDGMGDINGIDAIEVTDDARRLREADVIIAALNAPRPLDAGHLAADRPVVLLDVSVPSIVPPRLRRDRPLVRAVGVGRVRLPADPTVRVGGLLRPGAVFACAAEGLLLALDPALRGHRLVGPIDPAAVAAFAAAARRHGLTAAG